MALSDLRSQLRDYLTEDDTDVLSDQRLDELINYVTDDLNEMAKHPVRPDDKGFRLLEMQTAKFTVIQPKDDGSGDADPFVALPDDFLDMRYVTESSAPTNPPLEYVTPQGLIQEETTNPGELRVYTISNQSIRLPEGVIEVDETQIEMGYYEKIPALTDSEPTNWLLEKSPRVYLYGALTFAPLLLKDYDPGRAVDFYATAVTKLIDANEAAESTQGSVQIPTSYAVP